MQPLNFVEKSNDAHHRQSIHGWWKFNDIRLAVTKTLTIWKIGEKLNDASTFLFSEQSVSFLDKKFTTNSLIVGKVGEKSNDALTF